MVISSTNTKLQDMRLRENYFLCDIYKDLALIHTDSPSDTQMCSDKTYIDPITDTNSTIYSLP